MDIVIEKVEEEEVEYDEEEIDVVWQVRPVVIDDDSDEMDIE
jgi:hypothetical protein